MCRAEWMAYRRVAPMRWVEASGVEMGLNEDDAGQTRSRRGCGCSGARTRARRCNDVHMPCTLVTGCSDDALPVTCQGREIRATLNASIYFSPWPLRRA